MRKIWILLLFPFSIIAQEIEFKYWVQFKDKGTYELSQFQANDLVSQRSIERRVKQGISFHPTDLPIFPSYINQVKEVVPNILGKSKWFNGLMLQSAQNVDSLLNFDFVVSVDTIGFDIVYAENKALKFVEETHYYGATQNQIEMLNGHILHEQNAKGKGLQIALFDSGFKNVDVIPAFQHLFDNNQILGTWDFVDQKTSVYNENYHGMSVLSVIAAKLKNEFIGTAPEASFWLFRTEDVHSENLIEEYYWTMAAEKADSLGVDIINSSLGYTDFDYVRNSHTYSDLDGKTTPITRAALWASRKGMIVCNSAGNSGDDSWYYISAPADADSILSVGAVDEYEVISNFSSRGPSFDGRIKPTVCAKGSQTALINSSGLISNSNGTSFSSPVISGMTACLWQMHYQKSNMEIINAIIRSANYYQNPNPDYGYGIPNYAYANAVLLGKDNIDEVQLNISFNPSVSTIDATIYTGKETSFTYYIYDISGRIIETSSHNITYSEYHLESNFLNSGVYLLKVVAGENELCRRVEVIN